MGKEAPVLAGLMTILEMLRSNLAALTLPFHGNLHARAWECLEQSHKASPKQKEIEDALCQAKNLYARSRNGKYDISDFLLGFVPSLEVTNCVGPVAIT